MSKGLNYLNFLSIFKQTYITISVSFVSLLIGYSYAYTSIVIKSMVTEKSFKFLPRDELWFCIFLPIFSIIGGLIGGFVCYKYGRKFTIIMSSMLFAWAYLLIGLGKFKIFLFIGRILSGLGIGIGTLVLPVYLCEITDDKSRGSLTLLPAVFGNVGILLCYILGSFCNWKTIALVGTVPNVLFFISAFWIPESPRWFIQRGAHKKGYYILKYVLIKGDLVDEKYSEYLISQVDTLTKINAWEFKDYFNKLNLKPLFILLGLMFIQEISGIYAVVYFTMKTLAEANYILDGYLSMILLSVTNFLASLTSLIIINWIGRKTILYISNVIVVVILFILGVFFYLMEHKFDVSHYTWVPLVCLIVYMIGFSLGIGPIPWLLMGEIVPEIVLEITTALVTSFSFTCGFCLSRGFIDLAKSIGIGSMFWTLSGICLLGTVFIKIWVPETKNESLNNIQKKLSGQEL